MLEVLSRGKLTTLVFHKVPQVRHPLAPVELALPDFSTVLEATLRHFRVLPLDEAVISLRAGNLPTGSACITFDDGYPDWRTGVLPVLERLGVHATFFVTSGQYSGLPMWNERILHALRTAPAGTGPLQWSGLEAIRFGTQQDRQRGNKLLDEFLKYQEPAEKERLLRELERHTGVDYQATPSMSVADLRHLHARGFGIGSHSITHPILSCCTPQHAYEEIAGAREQLEALIKGKVTAFAYPNGTPGKDFGPEHIEMVRRAGYRYAVTTHRGVATENTSLMQIPRFTPWGPTAGRMGLQFRRNLMQRGTHLPEQASGHRRALMVAFHFPPQAGSSGILRSLNFVKYLPIHGWQVSVLTASPTAYVQQRNDLISSIPSDTVVIRASAIDAARHLAVKGKYLRLSALPDRWSTWWLPGVWAGLREVRRSRPRLIWSTYPIATAHLIGGTIAQLTGLPWIADFRDPMLNSNYPAPTLQRRIMQWLETRILRNASACVFTTASSALNYQQKYPDFASKCLVIENGYDDEAFEQAEREKKPREDGRMLMLHSGLIYPEDRDPSTFFTAVRQLIDHGDLNAEKLCIRFRAPGHGTEVHDCARRYGVEDVVEIAPPVPYQEAITEMMTANLLLVFQGSSFNAQVPAKIYEYVRSVRPILAVTDPEGETRRQLGQFVGVWHADIASTDSVAQAVLAWLASDRSMQEEVTLRQNLGTVQRYSRRAATAQLGELFMRLTRVAN